MTTATEDLRAALGDALPERPFRVELWDGTALPSTDGDRLTFRVTSPVALGHVLRSPGQLGVGRAYVGGAIDVDDVDAALDLLDTWRAPPLHPRAQAPLAPPAGWAGAARTSAGRSTWTPSTRPSPSSTRGGRRRSTRAPRRASPPPPSRRARSRPCRASRPWSCARRAAGTPSCATAARSPTTTT